MTSRIKFTTAVQVFEAFPDLVGDVSRPVKETAAAAYAATLANGDAPQSGIQYLAHALPKREAIWWAIQCMRGLDEPKSNADREMLSLSEAWVRESEEETRLAALRAAEKGERYSPATWIGYAVGWSAGSLSPNPDHPVPVPESLTAKLLGAAVLMMIGDLPTPQREPAIKACLSTGVSFAEGNAMPVVTLPEPGRSAGVGSVGSV